MTKIGNRNRPGLYVEAATVFILPIMVHPIEASLPSSISHRSSQRSFISSRYDGFRSRVPVHSFCYGQLNSSQRNIADHCKSFEISACFCILRGTGRSGAKRTKKQRQRKRAPLPLQKMQDSAQSFFSPNFSSAAALMAMTAPVMPTTEVLTQRS